MPSGSNPNLSNTDTVYPEHLSRLHRRVVPKKRKGGSSRYRTQPVTFSEIKEVDEDNVKDETASCRATSAQELQHLNERFELFRRTSDLGIHKEEESTNDIKLSSSDMDLTASKSPMAEETIAHIQTTLYKNQI